MKRNSVSAAASAAVNTKTPTTTNADATTRRTSAGYEQRRTRYAAMRKFPEMLVLHKEWWSQKTLDTREALPDARTLDARGNALSLAELNIRTNVGSMDGGVSKAAASRMNPTQFDTYIACFSTRAPPLEYRTIQDVVVAMHDGGFLVLEVTLPPTESKDGGYARGRMYVTGLIDKELADYVKIVLDESFEYDTFVTNPGPWLNVPKQTSGPLPRIEAPPGIELCVASHGMTAWAAPNGIRTFQKFPYGNKLQDLRDFLSVTNPTLLRHLSRNTVQMTILDRVENRTTKPLQFISRVLRNRFKVDNVESRTKGENFYRPAQVGLHRERELCERIDYTRMAQKYDPSVDVVELMRLTLEQLRDRAYHMKDVYDTAHHQHPSSPPPAAASPSPNVKKTTTTTTEQQSKRMSVPVPPTPATLIPEDEEVADEDEDDDDDDDDDKQKDQGPTTAAPNAPGEPDDDDDDEDEDEGGVVHEKKEEKQQQPKPVVTVAAVQLPPPLPATSPPVVVPRIRRRRPATTTTVSAPVPIAAAAAVAAPVANATLTV